MTSAGAVAHPQLVPSARSRSGRFLFIDGLRGVAALAVVCYHLNENLPSPRPWIGRSLGTLFGHGNLGVDVFFVLSGFVIFHSVRAGERSLRYLARFGVRRSIRLDPPLWATIAIEIVLIRVGLWLFPALATPLPTTSQIFANVTYAQRFFGIPSIVPVFWSLTYEVQFYMVLVGGLVLLHHLRAGMVLRELLYAAVFVYSLTIWVGLADLPLRGLFIDRWFEFALGIAAAAVLGQQLSVSRFAVLGIVTLLVAAAPSAGAYRMQTMGTSVVTASIIVIVGSFGGMDRVLAGPVIQYLGRISYSLYLIHLSIGWRLVSLAKSLIGPELGVLQWFMIFGIGVGVSIAAAWLLNVGLEAPSMRFAQRIRLPKTAGATAATVGPPTALPATATRQHDREPVAVE